MHAYCYASGLIEFGRTIPDGALPMAQGPAKPLREFIDANSRHGYKTRKVKGRPTRIPGTDHLLVPGIPEARLMGKDPLMCLQEFLTWIGRQNPKGITVHKSALRSKPAKVAKRKAS